ncbi:hypothetical protein KRP22_014265 [Phytophthora ramorum]|nr:hypothetical protein KRP22_9135 [Phytophthora ramorum]
MYALQPCGRLSTSLIMTSEMKKQHETIYNKFNGIDCPATRASKLLLADVARKPIDEARLLPLLDRTSFDVSQVAVRHVLDYVFFKEGERTHPAGAEFGNTIFDEVKSQRILTTTTASSQSENPSGISDGLSDSDEDEHVVGAPRRAARQEGSPEPKRRRQITTTDGRANPVSLSQAPVVPDASGLRLDPDVDQLISIHRSRAVTDASAQGDFNRAEGAAGKAHFHPTGMQTMVHSALMNGKYASFSAQQYVEFVQVHWRKFGFFPNPSGLCGLFGWDFGTRGLSILHFVRAAELEKRELVRKSDMSNFSKKNALSPPTAVSASGVRNTGRSI